MPSNSTMKPFCCVQESFLSIKTLLALLLGFYLGGLHSSFYFHRHDELHRANTDKNTAVNRPGARSFIDLASAGSNRGEDSQYYQKQRILQTQMDVLQGNLKRCESEKAINVALESDKQGSGVKVSPFAKQQQQEQHDTIPRQSINPLCQRFPFLSRESASSLWLDHITRIHKASQLRKNDPRFLYSDFTAQLLAIVAPRMTRSVLHVPTDRATIDRLLVKLDARYRYLHEGGPRAPPLKMIVMGGSILVGRNCRKLNKDLDLRSPLPNRECTYAHRLQKFLELIALSPDSDGDGSQTNLFQVTKIAMGGTNTAVGTQIFHYDLMPEEARNPDIVVNAYSTNDMHILTALEASAGNQTLGQRVFEITQDFVRAVLGNCQSDGNKPLLLHLDDYLGNEQREIMATMELSQAVGSLADYYGFGRMSYANLVRDIVYGDTKEHWFSPEGWWPSPNKPMEREIHPGMGMHIVAQWVVAYNLLNIATTFCSMEDYWPQESAIAPYESIKMSSVLPLRHQLKNDGQDLSLIPGKPKPPPDGLPPKLTPTLNLEFISEIWLSSSNEISASTTSCDYASGARCIFSWVGGLSLQQNNLTRIEEIFSVPSKEFNGWKLVNQNDKIGYMPSRGVGDKMVLEFHQLVQPIESITLFILKSYGSLWEGSQLTVSVSEKPAASAQSWEFLTSQDLSGIHPKNTSETYPETVFLPEPIAVGSSLQLRLELTGGTTFKIVGIAVCT